MQASHVERMFAGVAAEIISAKREQKSSDRAAQSPGAADRLEESMQKDVLARGDMRGRWRSDSRGECVREPFTESCKKLLGARGGNGGRGNRGCLLVKVERIFLSGKENVGQQL